MLNVGNPHHSYVPDTVIIHISIGERILIDRPSSKNYFSNVLQSIPALFLDAQIRQPGMEAYRNRRLIGLGNHVHESEHIEPK
jgi:hypothetical protein